MSVDDRTEHALWLLGLADAVDAAAAGDPAPLDRLVPVGLPAGLRQMAVDTARVDLAAGRPGATARRRGWSVVSDSITRPRLAVAYWAAVPDSHAGS